METNNQTPPSLFMERLTQWSLTHRVSVSVVLISILVIGFIAALGIPLELFPRGYQASFLSVYIPWKNAPVPEVLEKITYPLEEELGTIKGLDQMNTWTFSGGSRAFLQFKQGADMDVAYREVRDRVERARLLFPDDVERVFTYKEDLSNVPVAVIGVALDPNIVDYYNFIQKQLILPLSRIDGVARVGSDGLEEKEILIEIDKDLAEGFGLNMFQLANDLGEDNFSMASGTVRDSGKKFLLKSQAKFRTVEELENRVVRENIRLKDIARIRYEEAEKNYSVRVNGGKAVALIVIKESTANTVDLSAEVRKAVEELKKDPRLGDSFLELIFDQGSVIEQSVGNLVQGGKVGGVLAAVVLLLFLCRIRLTLILSFSIPLCLLIALTVMFFIGETLNLLSLLGLVICVGLLVDNSVVVSENILRYRQNGFSRFDSCVKGTAEIALAVTLATLTTVAVFLPVSLVEGQGQFFLLRLSLPVTVSLLASLFVAIWFIPLCVFLTMQGGKNVDSDGARWWRKWYRFLWFQKGVEGLKGFYMRALTWSMHHRLGMVLVIFLVFSATKFIAFDKVGFVNVQEENKTGFQISVAMGAAHDFKDTSEYFEKAEAILKENQEAFELQAYVVIHQNNSGRLEGWFKEGRKGTQTPKEMAERVMKELPKKPGVKVYYGEEERGSEAKGKEVYVVQLEGDHSESLRELANRLEELFLQVDGVLASRKREDVAPNELAIEVDRERAFVSGANPEWIAGVVGYALRGRPLPRFYDENRQVGVRVRYVEEDRDTLSKLNQFQVPTQSGAMLPLSALTTTRHFLTPKTVFRKNHRLSQTITLELIPDKAKTARETLNVLQASMDLPEGITFGRTQQNSEMEEIKKMAYAGILSIVFIYLLMCFLFESLILPLSIIFTIPLAAIGVGWVHYFMGKDIDFLGFVGAILLVGVVVNNGIVLIDYANRLRSQGHEIQEALVLAVNHRFRPILMTALTTIIGMIPLTLGEPGKMGLSYESFGLTLIGGMTTSTLMTLLVIPVFYSLFEDLKDVVAGAFRGTV